MANGMNGISQGWKLPGPIWNGSPLIILKRRKHHRPGLLLSRQSSMARYRLADWRTGWGAYCRPIIFVRKRAGRSSCTSCRLLILNFFWSPINMTGDVRSMNYALTSILPVFYHFLRRGMVFIKAKNRNNGFIVTSAGQTDNVTSIQTLYSVMSMTISNCFSSCLSHPTL